MFWEKQQVTILFTFGGTEMTKQAKQQSNPFSTGGGGLTFETRVQAAFVVLMITGRISPCLPPWQIKKIKLQGRYAGFNTDDFIVFVKDTQSEKEAKLLAQIKHSISITERNETFGEVIQSAWNDFNNSGVFSNETDAFALITGPLSATDINDTRTILEWARYSEDQKEFLYKVNLANFSSHAKKYKLKVFRNHLNKANGGEDVSDEVLWRFLKSFYIIGYDLDTESGSGLSLLLSLIAQNSMENALSTWSRIVDIIQSRNQNAGTLTIETLPEDIKSAFNARQTPQLDSDIKKLKDHSDYIISGIRSNIGGVYINRNDLFERLLELSEESEFVFLSGERGCGKSSLVREFTEYMKDRAPVFCLRTEDLEKPHLDNVFSAIGLSCSLGDLETGFALIPKKYLMIESLEKTLELQNTCAFTDLIQFVRRHPGWTIIASGREYSYQQITFNFLQTTGVNYSSLLINGFSDNDIEYLCEKIESLKPLFTNQLIKPLLKNPFFADLAFRVTQLGTQFSSNDGEKEFRLAVWRDVISKEQVRGEGMPLRRKQTFIDIAVRRAKQMVYGVPETEFDFDALLRLEEDDLIRRDLSNGLVSPAHDVLEDWAIERYIEEAFHTSSGNVRSFLDIVGHEPAMNRAFRFWLYQKLTSSNNVTTLIHAILNDREIQRSWQDETISAILLSGNPSEFLFKMKDQLFENDFELLQRFCFILRISCKTPHQELIQKLSGNKDQTSNFLNNLILKPHGLGWEALIHFLYENRNNLTADLLSHLTAVLNEWSSLINIEKELPSPARESGLLALQLLNICKDRYRDEGDRKKLLAVILKVISAIIDEFNEMLESDVFGIDRRQQPPYVKDLCDMALLGMVSFSLCKHYPDTVIKLAFHKWLIDDSKNDQDYVDSFQKDVEECFGLHKYGSGTNFFPPSGAKGPFHYLLQFHPRKGLDFIIRLLNITADKYAQSDLDLPERYSSIPDQLVRATIKQAEQVQIKLNDGTSVNQYCSGRLWGAYRGHTVVPHLLESALMAMENWLINLIELSKSVDTLEWIFDHILRNSNSVMPTAVLSSVATGFSDKLGKAALPLLRTPELYELDLNRIVQERGNKEINWHNTLLNRDPLANIYTEERRRAALRPWRTKHLEDLIIQLQLSKMRTEILNIIDDLRSKAPTNENWRFRFHRIDTRNWEPKVDKENNRIIFSSRNLDTDLEEIQQKTQESHQLNNRFIALFLWSDQNFKKEALDREYYSNWMEAFTEAKSLLEIINSGAASDLARMQYGGIVKAAAVFLRDHSDQLNEDDLFWCINLIVHTVTDNADSDDIMAIGNNTDLDGAVAAASVLPIMLEYAMKEDEKFAVKQIIVTALTHASAAVRTEAANGIREHLWQRDSDFAQKCILGTVEYARLELEELNSRRQIGGLANASSKSNEKKFEERLDQFRQCFAKGEVTADLDGISFISHSSKHLLNACLIIPNASTDTTHISLLSKMLNLLFEAEESARRHSYDRSSKIEIHYEIPLTFAKRFANYLLCLSERDVQIFINHLQNGCETAPDFINTLLMHIAYYTEIMGKKDLYWRFWKQLSYKVQGIAVSICRNYSKYDRSDYRLKLIRGMLHSDTPWQKIDHENQDIALGKDLILEFVTNAGINPDVFEAMTSLMYHFPSIFKEPGLHILSKHQKETGGLHLFSGVNTVFYLERAIQRYLLLDNTEPLPRDLHEACCVLLNALIEMASSEAYYLREHLIRSRRIIN